MRAEITMIKTKKLISKGFVFLMVTIFLSGCSSMSNQSYCHINNSGSCDQPNIAAPTAYGYPLNDFAGNPIRKSENVQQIWIGPYEDQDGNFHEPSYVYAVVKSGSWIGDPEKAIRD